MVILNFRNGIFSQSKFVILLDVCSLRMDMESFTIQGTGNTEEFDASVTPPTEGGVCIDTFNVQVLLIFFLLFTGQQIQAFILSL